MDDIRVPYGRKSIKKPRRTSFCATVNHTDFLVDETGNRRFLCVPVISIDNRRLEKLGVEWIKQLWTQSYFETKDNLQKFRLNQEERKELEKRNYQFTELSPCEEELTLRMDFSGNTREVWTSLEINSSFFNERYSPNVIGKAIYKIQRKHPDLIDIKVTNRGKLYTLPIKKSGDSNK